MRIVVGIVLVLAVAAGVAGITTYSYHFGLAQGLAQSGKVPAPGPGAGPYPGYPYGFFPYHPFGFGFGFFGLLWPVLIVLLVFALARGLYWRGHAWGGHGGRGVPRRFEEWHRRAHESEGRTGSA